MAENFLGEDTFALEVKFDKKCLIWTHTYEHTLAAWGESMTRILPFMRVDIRFTIL